MTREGLDAIRERHAIDDAAPEMYRLPFAQTHADRAFLLGLLDEARNLLLCVEEGYWSSRLTAGGRIPMRSKDETA